MEVEAPVPQPRLLKFPRKTVVITATAFVVLIALGAGSAYVWADQYQGHIAPNIAIGPVDVSGLEPALARIKVQNAVDQLLGTGIPVIFNGSQTTLPLSASGTDAVELVSFEVDAAIAKALAYRRSSEKALDTLYLIQHLVTRSNEVIAVPVTLHEEAIKTSIRSLYPDAEMAWNNASFSFSRIGADWQGRVESARPGRVFSYPSFFRDLTAKLSVLTTEGFVTLEIVSATPSITDADAQAVLANAETAMRRAPYSIMERPEGTGRTWPIPAKDLGSLLRPDTSGDGLRIGIDAETWKLYLEEHVSPEVEELAVNARFQIEDGKVKEFAGSAQGVSLDVDGMRAALEQAIAEDTTSIILATFVTEPEITTEEVNDLGVTTLLGTGTSSYKGSPKNRIQNIKNGVQLLNGLLIAPGETFSLLNALQPFVAENGYLPELVIKGDKITPEIGGGLCQIGTTTFRAAMKSGLPIAERRNHSLVVSYYNDPANGKPGTDATIYDPAPDLKFTNDTGHFVLFEALNNTKTQALSFSFWGTSDGRKGSYTPPVVIRWLPVGETKRIESADLKPGEETCQGEHVGADTTFTYTVLKADGSTVDTVFDSHYRPLPKICLVGVTPIPGETPAVPETILEPTVTP